MEQDHFPCLQLVRCHMSSFDNFYRAWMNRDRNQAEVTEACNTFEGRHGKLLHYSFFQGIGAGVGLSENGELFFVDPVELGREDIELLILKAKNLYRDGQAVLDAAELYRCSEDLYFVICGLFAAQEGAINASTEERGRKLDIAAKIHREELAWAEANFKACSIRTTQARYLEGTLIGLLPLVIAGTVLFNTVNTAFESKQISLEILGAWIAAGLGAILSVLTRLTAGRLTLDSTPSAVSARFMGGCRPLIGACMGLVLLTFIKSGWIPLAMPDVVATPEKGAFFFAGGYVYCRIQ